MKLYYESVPHLPLPKKVIVTNYSIQKEKGNKSNYGKKVFILIDLPTVPCWVLMDYLVVNL